LNGAPSSILNQLNSKTTQTAKNKTCVTANYLETTDFIGTASAVTPIDLLNFVPNRNSIASIRIGCVANAMTMLQLVYNNYNDSGSTVSPIVGSATTSVNDILYVDLSAAFRIKFDGLTAGPALTFAVTTYDANNNVLSTVQCGTGTGGNSVVVLASDFLGLTDIFSNGSIIQSFEVTQYKE